MRNGSTKLACSCENALRNFAVRKGLLLRKTIAKFCTAKHSAKMTLAAKFRRGCEIDMISKMFLLHHPALEIEQFLQNKNNSIK